MLRHCDRIVVMRDGKVVLADVASAFDRERLIGAMGGVESAAAPERASAAAGAGEGEIRVRIRPARAERRAGTRRARGRDRRPRRARRPWPDRPAASPPSTPRRGGARARRSTRPSRWSPATASPTACFRNGRSRRTSASARSRRLRVGPLISRNREAALANAWRERIKIRTPDVDDNILSLSGGNQQKALFARALGSDAKIVLMDDPMRGVDYGTKLEVYELVREEARGGRTFLWYTTETEELKNCDRVYVFRDGAIVAQLGRDEFTEERVIHSSFAGAP